MNLPKKWTEVIGGKRYSVATATLIASDAYWDGHNWERHGTNTFLLRTPNGNYFTAFLTQWQGSRDELRAVSQDEAIRLWEEDLPEHEMSFEAAFPGITVVEA